MFIIIGTVLFAGLIILFFAVTILFGGLGKISNFFTLVRAKAFITKLQSEYQTKGYTALLPQEKKPFEWVIRLNKSDLSGEALKFTVVFFGGADLVWGVTLQSDPSGLFKLGIGLEGGEPLERPRARSISAQSDNLDEESLRVTVDLKIDDGSSDKPYSEQNKQISYLEVTEAVNELAEAIVVKEPIQLIADLLYASPDHEQLELAVMLENSARYNYPFNMLVFRNPPEGWVNPAEQRVNPTGQPAASGLPAHSEASTAIRAVHDGKIHDDPAILPAGQTLGGGQANQPDEFAVSASDFAIDYSNFVRSKTAEEDAGQAGKPPNK